MLSPWVQSLVPYMIYQECSCSIRSKKTKWNKAYWDRTKIIVQALKINRGTIGNCMDLLNKQPLDIYCVVETVTWLWISKVEQYACDSWFFLTSCLPSVDTSVGRIEAACKLGSGASTSLGCRTVLEGLELLQVQYLPVTLLGAVLIVTVWCLHIIWVAVFSVDHAST